MFVFEFLPDASKEDFYRELNSSLVHLIEGQRNWVTNYSNASGLLKQGLSALNHFREKPVIWAGFYVTDPKDPTWLYLGPFQGKVACTRIKFGRGVCGAAASSKQTQVVKNVHEFPGHIACDSASNSEIVVPVLDGDNVLAVLDIDSSEVGAFDEEDLKGLEEFCRILVEGSDSPLN